MKILLLIGVFLSLNAQALVGSPNNLKLAPNVDGYKLKMVANLSDLPIVNDYYPSFYTAGYSSKPIINTSGLSSEYKKLIVQGGYLYGLMTFKKLDKYSNSFTEKDKQLRLCKIKLVGGTKWDCSLVIDSKGGNSGQLFDSASTGKIAGIYTDIDGIGRVFLYEPKDLTVSYVVDTNEPISSVFNPVNGKTELYNQRQQDLNSVGRYLSFSNDNVYYRDDIIYETDSKLDISHKIIDVFGQVHPSDFSCVYSNDGMGQMKGNYYSSLNNRLFNLNYNTQKGVFMMGNQVGETNGVIGELRFIPARINLYGNLIFLSPDDYRFHDLYYIPTSANQNTPWKKLSILNTEFSQAFLVPGDSDKIYFAMNLKFSTSSNFKDSLFIYEISK